jgi:hypothetical protein
VPDRSCLFALHEEAFAALWTLRTKRRFEEEGGSPVLGVVSRREASPGVSEVASSTGVKVWEDGGGEMGLGYRTGKAETISKYR